MTDTRYMQRPVAHARLDKGGYMWAYEILYKGTVIGSLSILRETRGSDEQRSYTLLGRPPGHVIQGTADREFATVAEFIAAHQAINP